MLMKNLVQLNDNLMYMEYCAQVKGCFTTAWPKEEKAAVIKNLFVCVELAIFYNSILNVFILKSERCLI